MNKYFQKIARNISITKILEYRRKRHEIFNTVKSSASFKIPTPNNETAIGYDLKEVDQVEYLDYSIANLRKEYWYIFPPKKKKENNIVDVIYSIDDFQPTDKPTDYYNFVNQNKNIVNPIKLRLGNFRVNSSGQRNKEHYPKEHQHKYPAPIVGVLHIPVADIKTKTSDQTAEATAKYLSNKKNASVHLTSDRDSFVLCLPFDTIAWHCANTRTHQVSLGIEMGGLGQDKNGIGLDSYNGIRGDEYWSTEDAILKYRLLARGYIAGMKLLYKEDWYAYSIPLQKAKLSANGGCITPGWTQHREIPIWNNESRKFFQPGSAGLNQTRGQHTDICANFPWELFFKIFEEEIEKS